MSRIRKYNPNNCNHRIVAQFESVSGDKIALLAHHAFAWKVVIQVNGSISMQAMPREKARREYKRLEKIMKPLS